MKKCPSCGSINSEDNRVCGMCGRDLSDVLVADLADEPATKVPAAKPSRHVNVAGLAGLLVGLGMVGMGFYALFGFASLSVTRFLIAIVIIPLGTMVTLAVYNLVTGRPYRPMGERRGRPYGLWGGGRGAAEVEREAEREEEEERRRETGEAD